MGFDGTVQITVVVPAFNEEERLLSTLPHLWRGLKIRFASFEIIVVDDGSIDGTERVVAGFARRHPEARLIRHEKNRGKGYALKCGALAAAGKYILFSDADLSTPIGEVDKLLRALEDGCDIAIGSRARQESRIARSQPLYRVLMGKTFNRIVKLFALRGIDDTQCGFKCFRRHVAREVLDSSRIDGFSFDVEALFIARRKGMTIREIGVLWRNSPQSKVHPVLHSVQMMKELILIRYHALMGHYGARVPLRTRIEVRSSQ